MTQSTRFLWLYDQLTERPMKGMQIAVLFVLLVRDEAGLPPVTKADLGALIGVTERHVSNILRELQYDLALIQARKGSKPGKGRAPNCYVTRPDSIGAPVPDDWITNCKTGTVVPEKTDKKVSASADSVVSRNPKTGTTVHEACGEPAPPMDKHGRARGLDNPLTTGIGSSSETLVDVSEGVCGAREIAMPIGPGDLSLDWVLSPDDRAFAGERGYVNGSCDELFGQFLDHCATKGPRHSAHWRSEWRKWVRNQVKFDTERAQRNSGTSHDVNSTRTSDGFDVRRPKVSASSANLLRQMRGDPDDERGVDYRAGK